MNQEQIDKDLRTMARSPFQDKVLSQIQGYMKLSSAYMSKYWDAWDHHMEIFRAFRVFDKEDTEDERKKLPPKIILPTTYAQIQTALSYLIAIFTQRKDFFEMEGNGPEDVKVALALQTDLTYQTNKNKMVLVLYCWLLDALRFGVGVVKTHWTEETYKQRTQTLQQDTGLFSRAVGKLGFGTPKPKMIEETVDVLSYQGNMVENLSPFSFFPDPGVPLARFQDGVFVAHEDEISHQDFRNEEGVLYHGTHKIPDSISTERFDSRKRRAGSKPNEGTETALFRSTADATPSSKFASRSEIVFNMIPKEWSEKTGVDLGSEERTIKVIATVANDSKIVRFEPYNFFHNQFPYALIEYSPDSICQVNPGLSGTLDDLQNTMNWFLTSHIANVKKIIRNQFIVNPEFVEISDIEGNKAAIRTKGKPRRVEEVLQQLNVTDATKGHVQDLEKLESYAQQVSGFSENSLSQFASGRRSATEARSVNFASTSRLKMHAMIAWDQGLEPLAQMFISNTRQSRTKEVYDHILGEMALDIPFEVGIFATPNRIAGNYDFVPFDGTLGSERSLQANFLKDIFSVMIQNPETMTILQKDPMKLLFHIAKLVGVKNLKDFDLEPTHPLFNPEVQVQPDQQVADQVGANGANGSSRVEPVDTSGEDLIRGLIGAR